MKSTIIAVVFSLLLIFGIYLISKPSALNEPSKVNVTVVDGKQTIDLTAKGGFSPRKSIAKAGLPTTLKVTTSNTFDCSSSILIPSMNIGRSLQPSSTTSINIGIQPVGVLKGSCGMGMYPFEIDFQ